MHGSAQLVAVLVAGYYLILQRPYSVEEALAALYAVLLPGSGFLEVADEHLVQAQGIRAEFPYNIVRVNDVALGLRHLCELTGALGVLAEYHSVGGTLHVRLLAGNDALVVQELVPETAVQQVERGVLHAAVVPVNGHPVFERFLGGKLLVVVRVAVTQEVPAGTSPLGHCISLALCGATAARAGGVDEALQRGKRAFTGVCGHVAVNFRQLQREFALGERYPAALLAVDNGDRLAPVSLTGEYPVAQLVVHLFATLAVCGEPLLYLHLCFLDGKPVQELGIHHNAGGAVGERFLLDVLAALYYLDYRQVKYLCELPVAGVVRGYCHDGAGAVGHQNIVGNEDRYFLAVNGIYRADALQLYAGLVLVHLGAVEVGLARCGCLVFADSVHILQLVSPLLNDGVLRGDYHISRAEQRVGACGVYRQHVAGCGGEIHLGAGGAAYPVLLSGLYLLEVINAVQVVDEPLSVLGYLEHPLALHLVDYLAAAALADAVNDFLVSQYDLAGGAPVHIHFLLVCKAGLEQLEEYPLRPLEVIGVGGVYLPVPVKGKTQGLKLCLEARNVVLCYDSGVYLVLDGEVLSGQTECVPAHREQHIVALQPALSGYDIHSGVGAGVSDVESLTGGVGELYQRVELRPGIVVFSVERLVFVPVFLPLAFNGGKIITHFFDVLSAGF
ncbi:uncharacterized protein BN782_00673 [Eubacterium sp. CAG:786]|nr:uncharacterized protein BN782_00673 [Eubacterium sp. CAG:786]